MNIPSYLFLIIVFVIYSAANYYIGRRGWQCLRLSTSLVRGKCYISVILLLALAYPLARSAESILPSAWLDGLTLLGAFWLGSLYYLFIFTLLLDIVRAINQRKKFLPISVTEHPAYLVAIILCIIAVLISYGAWNARHPVTRHYEITIPKTTSTMDTLQVVMVSDLHLSNILDNKYLTRLINRINQLEPDIVLLAGDIIDSKADILRDQHMIENFARLHPPLGTYAILGNHEYIEKKPELAIDYLQQGNIHVLRDQYALIADSFYVVGRDDLSKKRYTGIDRQDLATVMNGMNHTLPIILLDHQPQNLQDGVTQGADLQLSGHTHLGQLFPNNLLTNRIYELDWGYLRKESLQVIVSCGLGTWGPPIRIGNHPEIVTMTIHFSTTEQQE